MHHVTVPALPPDLKGRVVRSAGRSADRWRRLRRKVDEIGLPYAAKRLFDRLSPTAVLYVNMVDIFERDLRGRATAGPAGREIRWATAQDLEMLAAFGGERRELEARFARGARVAVLERRGRPLARCWFETGQHERPGLRYRLAPGDVWMWDAYVLPEFRRRGLFRRLNDFAAREYRRAGYVRVLSAVETLNRNSVRAHLALGARLRARMFCLSLFGLNLIHVGQWMRVGRWGLARRLDLPVEML